NILLDWRELDNEKDCLHFVKVMTNSDKDLVAFLVSALEKAIDQSMTEYRQTSEWEISLNAMTVFIQTDKLQEHAKVLFEDEHFEKLREREQLALIIFLDLIK